MTVEEALALIGVYLRLRGDFGYHHSGSSSVSFGRSGFYRSLAGDLLPDSERWFACCPGKTTPWEVAPRDLADAVVTRLERALRARDRLHHALLVERGFDANDEALLYFDAILLSLNGAFDAVARVVHNVYGMEGSIFEANWRKDHRPRKAENSYITLLRRVLKRIAPALLAHPRATWMQQLRARAPDVARLMFPHEPARDALEAVAVLRNSIHAETFSTVGLRDVDAAHTDYPIVVPPLARRDLVGVVRRRGGDVAWGIRELDRDAIVLDVHTFVEQVFGRVVTALADLMRATEVERLDPTSATRAPSNGPTDGALQRIRLLSGLAT